jgi:hypothetical protein
MSASITPAKISRLNKIFINLQKTETGHRYGNPGQKAPPLKARKEYQKLMPMIIGLQAPVHTPVPGRGMATKISNPKAPYFSTW